MCVIRSGELILEPDDIRITGRNAWPCQIVINVIWGKEKKPSHHLATLPQAFQDVVISFIPNEFVLLNHSEVYRCEPCFYRRLLSK